MNGIFQLGWRDLVKGLITAIFTSVAVVLGNWVNIPEFNILTANWSILLTVAITSGLSYLVKNLLTNNQGKFLGQI